ncbi:hypothetical protein V6N13_032946 [Hibiscus sabdariffa]
MPFGRTGDYTIYQENYNMSRDLKSFLFHATDKNLAYVSPRFLLGSQSFVMDASERSKFIVNLEWMVEPTVQKDTVLSVVLYYKRNSYQCPGDIIRFCNNAFKHCNDHLRNTGSWQCLSGECWANGTATGPLLPSFLNIPLEMQRINGYFAHEQYEWLIGSQYKPVELAKSDWVAIRKAPPWAIDSWGCLIYEIFSGMKLGETEELRDTSIPKPLLSDYQRLLSSLPSRRLNTSKLIDNSEIFQNKLVDTVHFMEILSLKDSVERDTFFRKLPTLAEQLRCQIVLNKIFPLLTSALEYGSAAAPALNALLKTGSRLSVEEFYLKVLPTIVKLFASNDRAIRVALLQHIVQYGEPLSAQVVDDQVYPHIATGFSGTSAFLRELTLKSLLLLAPKVEEPAIRTNTTILLGNIASYLNSNREMRQTWNKEATIHICDENTIHSYFSGKKAPYTGVVIFDGGQRNDSTFLAYQTKEESDNMHHALLCRSDNNSLLYHHRLHYKDKDKDEWLIAVEASQTVYSYFDDMRVKWRPSKRLSRFAQRSEWFKHIKDDFEAIFQSTAKIWSTLIDETSHRSIYTNCPEKCLWFTNDGKVKVLPNLDHGASSSSNDIDRLQQFMMQIITMPFGHTGDYTIYQENYNLSRDLKSFLFHATDKNLAYVSPRFLLGSQSFVMDASERSKFIVNLEVLLQQHAIDETDFFYYISELSRHSLKQWMVKPTVQKDTVFSAILYYKRNSYQCPGDIIRFCNNAFKHCNDHLRNTGVLGHHKKDIESRLSIAFPCLSGMVHGNACLESVVVMRTLDWKLHAFDVLSEYDEAKWNCYRTIAGNACVDASKTTYITVVNLLFVKTAIVSRKREELNRLRPEEPNTSSG